MNRPVALAGVAVGAAGVAAALTGMYLAMRELMVDTGGYCASGGPYQVAPGHSCDGTRSWVLTAAPFAGLALVALLIAASDSWSGGRVSGLGALVWGAMFGALGWNFLDLGIHPPQSSSGSGAWILCAVLFWGMALGGIVYGVIAIRDYFRPAGSTPSAPITLPPLVRAVTSNVSGMSASLPGMKVLDSANAALKNDLPAGNAYVWLVTVLAAAGVGVVAISAIW